jgi:hypothetical protein
MFLIAKMALVTCAFYIGIAALIEAALLGVVYWKGGILYWLNFKGWAPIFGIVWFASFALAWRLMIVPVVAKFPR